MAKRRRLYKTVNVATKSLGATGDQIHLGTIDKIDAQGANGYFNNLRLSLNLNDSSGLTALAGGYIAYLTTDDSWSDDSIITARAGNFASQINLPAKRTIRQNSDNVLGNMGQVHLWVECTDVSLLGVEVRYLSLIHI